VPPATPTVASRVGAITGKRVRERPSLEDLENPGDDATAAIPEWHYDLLAEFAGIHSHDRGFYRIPPSKFHSNIYYAIIAGEAVVFRVLDMRRDPKYIRQQLRLTRRTLRTETARVHRERREQRRLFRGLSKRRRQ
jgi:hypothetical protein